MYTLVYGCPPGSGVAAETKMMYDISDAFLNGVDDNMICAFPELLDHLVGTDVNFELLVSSNIQTLRLFYIHNSVWTTIGLVFVQTQLKGFGEYVGDMYESTTTAKSLGEKAR